MLAFATISTAPFEVQVARKCAGESRTLLPQCACVVLNRIHRGWSRASVLIQFFAPDRQVTAVEVAGVKAVLEGKAPCDPRWYFMYSRADVYYLGIQGLKPIALFELGHGDAIYMYEYAYKWRK